MRSVSVTIPSSSTLENRLDHRDQCHFAVVIDERARQHGRRQLGHGRTKRNSGSGERFCTSSCSIWHHPGWMGRTVYSPTAQRPDLFVARRVRQDGQVVVKRLDAPPATWGAWSITMRASTATAP